MLAISTTTDAAGPLADHELAAWRGMLEAHARTTRILDAELREQHGLALPAYEVLMFLADADGHRLRMSEIADRVLLSRSACTRLVDRLVDLGYVTRSAAETDGRGAFAELTKAGLAKLTPARETHRAGIRRVFLDHLTATDTIVLGDIWTRFLAAASE